MTSAINEAYAHLYDQDGPFVTVYLDATRASENGAHEVELRWRALRGELEQRGATPDDLAALDAAVAADAHPGRHGLVLVAVGGAVGFADTLPRPPARQEATLAPLPHLMPYLAQRGPRVPYLLVLADRTGADISTPSWLGGRTETIQGSEQYPVRKTGRNTWDELHFQHRVENSWEANAKEAAEEVVKEAIRIDAELVVLAGDERAMKLLDTALAQGLRSGVEVVYVGEGGRAEGASRQALQESVQDAVLHHVWRKRRELLEHLRQNLGRAEYGVAGVPAVIDALRRAAVDTVVISDDPSSTLHAYVGPEAVQLGATEQELHDLGVGDPQRDRLDAALIRTAHRTGAHVIVTPNAHEYVQDGIAALLRYDERATG